MTINTSYHSNNTLYLIATLGSALVAVVGVMAIVATTQPKPLLGPFNFTVHLGKTGGGILIALGGGGVIVFSYLILRPAQKVKLETKEIEHTRFKDEEAFVQSFLQVESEKGDLNEYKEFLKKMREDNQTFYDKIMARLYEESNFCLMTEEDAYCLSGLILDDKNWNTFNQAILNLVALTHYRQDSDGIALRKGVFRYMLDDQFTVMVDRCVNFHFKAKKSNSAVLSAIAQQLPLDLKELMTFEEQTRFDDKYTRCAADYEVRMKKVNTPRKAVV